MVGATGALILTVTMCDARGRNNSRSAHLEGKDFSVDGLVTTHLRGGRLDWSLRQAARSAARPPHPGRRPRTSGSRPRGRPRPSAGSSAVWFSLSSTGRPPRAS